MWDLMLFFVVKLGFVVSSMLFSGIIDHRIKNRSCNALVQGLLFSFVIFIDISMPFEAPNGTHFDVREILLNISGIFYGPIAGGIASIFTLAYRTYRGSQGTLPALIGILTIYLWTVAVYRYSEPRKLNTCYKTVYILAFVTNLISAVSVLVVPVNRTQEPMIVTAVMLLFYPLATIASAKLINEINERHFLMKKLVRNEEKLERKNKLLIETISKIRRQEQMLRQSEEMFRGLFLNSSDACFVLQEDKIIKTNHESLILFGVEDSSEFDHHSILEFLPEQSKSDFISSLNYVNQGEEMKNREFFVSDKKGILIDVEGTMSCVRIGRDKYIYLSLRDIRRRKLKEKEFVRSMQTDALTGTYNRGYLREYMKDLCSGDYPVGIVMADLNGLKLINDFLGHAMGDAALAKAAEVLRAHVPEKGAIARMGGDEFVLFFPKSDEAKMKEMSEKIRASLAHVKSEFGEISISIGISNCKLPGEDIMKMISSADHDMYRHKSMESVAFKKQFLESIYTASFENNIFKHTYESRILDLCDKFAVQADLSEKEKNDLLTCCKYYDLGHAYFDPNSIEFPRVENTYNLLRQLPDMFEVATDILFYPENWDGSGHHRLSGDQIPTVSMSFRIIRDYFFEKDLLYRSEENLHRKEARLRVMDILQRRKGEAYDPNLWAVFEEMMKIER